MMATASADDRCQAARWLMLVLVAVSSTMAMADTPPAGDFLEYLGSWEEGDEDWLAVAEWSGEDAAEDGESATGKDEVNDDEPES